MKYPAATLAAVSDLCEQIKLHIILKVLIVFHAGYVRKENGVKA